jgi:beta-lactamase class C
MLQVNDIPATTSAAATADPINQRVAAFRQGLNDVPAVMLGMVRPLEPGAAEVYYDVRAYGTIPASPTDLTVRRPPTPSTIFEIGSITKTFTGTALAWLASQQKVAIVGPAQNLLPTADHGGVTLPTWKGTGAPAPITCAALADFTSGFPSDSSGSAIPGHNHEVLFRYLNEHPDVLTFAPGTQYVYADAAFELLGSALAYANRQNYDYGALLQDLLNAGGLLMPDTVVTLSPEQQTRVAPGLCPDGTFAHFRPGEWLIQSTMSDMMVWLTFNMSLLGSCPLNDLLPTTQTAWFTQPQGESEGMKSGNSTGLGCFIEPLGDPGQKDTPIRISKNGATSNGFSSYICFIQGGSTGVVLLTNLNKTHVGGLGNQLLQDISA